MNTLCPRHGARMASGCARCATDLTQEQRDKRDAVRAGVVLPYKLCRAHGNPVEGDCYRCPVCSE